MSYEGYDEYILEDGSYQVKGCWDSPPQNAKWWHSVDVTNGYEESVDYACDAPKKETGYYDVWKEDHYGNKYAVKVLTYEPASDCWKSINWTSTKKE